MKVAECCFCGILFGMPENVYDLRLKDGRNFTCPNGHAQRFTRKEKEEAKLLEDVQRLTAELQKLKKQAHCYKKQCKQLERTITALRGAITRLKKVNKNPKKGR